MARRNTHEKASDVFDKTQFFLAKKVTFEQAFPEIESVSVDVTERDVLSSSEHGRSYQTSSMPGEFINCSNPPCYNGGFSIGRILCTAVRTKQTLVDTTECCQGYEGTPKGKRNYGSCMNQFHVVVTIKYKETGEPPR